MSQSTIVPRNAYMQAHAVRNIIMVVLNKHTFTAMGLIVQGGGGVMRGIGCPKRYCDIWWDYRVGIIWVRGR